MFGFNKVLKSYDEGTWEVQTFHNLLAVSDFIPKHQQKPLTYHLPDIGCVNYNISCSRVGHEFGEYKGSKCLLSES